MRTRKLATRNACGRFGGGVAREISLVDRPRGSIPRYQFLPSPSLPCLHFLVRLARFGCSRKLLGFLHWMSPMASSIVLSCSFSGARNHPKPSHIPVSVEFEEVMSFHHLIAIPIIHHNPLRIPKALLCPGPNITINRTIHQTY